MTKLKLTPKKSLGRVLSLNEMKSIFGGSNATITCTCTLVKFYKTEHEERERAEPIGDFHTSELCKTACNEACSRTPNCNFPLANYNLDMDGSSGSEDEGEFEDVL